MSVYLEAFGLKREPFGMSPDPTSIFLTPLHREALAGVTYAVLDRKGFGALIGDAGTGKTTILSRVLRHLPASRVSTSVILNPTLTPAEFIESVLLDFGFNDIPESKARRLLQLQQFLLKEKSENRIAVLVVDEAHKLSSEVLEEIRLLGNMDDGEHKLLQIILSGQSELTALLNRDDLRQLKQRIAIRLTISPLTAPETDLYIEHRWRAAGATAPGPFSGGARQKIAQYSRGIPRLINAICDNALTAAFSTGGKEVEDRHVISAAVDLDLESASRSVPATVPVPAAVSAPIPAVSTLAAQPVAAATSRIITVPTFERYGRPNEKRSPWERLASKLRLTREEETE